MLSSWTSSSACHDELWYQLKLKLTNEGTREVGGNQRNGVMLHRDTKHLVLRGEARYLATPAAAVVWL
jgi:hypothetical protein